jgi:hypothetical protein
MSLPNADLNPDTDINHYLQNSEAGQQSKFCSKLDQHIALYKEKTPSVFVGVPPKINQYP